MYSSDGLDRDLDKRLHALSGNKYLSLMKAAKEEKVKEFNFLSVPTQFPALSKEPEQWRCHHSPGDRMSLLFPI